MKNIKQIIIVSLILSALISCVNKQTCRIEFENTNGLKNKAKVLYKSHKIGEVININLNEERKVIVDVTIDKDFVFPDNYKFVMISMDYFGTKAIELRETEGEGRIKIEPILKGEIEETNIIDSFSNQVIDVFKKAALNQTTKQDSVLIELRRLNKNLEDLKGNK